MTTTLDTFSSAITRIRNIFRTVAITGMDSLRHTCLYLMARYITEARAPGLGIPPAFAWEALLRTARTVEGGRQIALDSFNNKVSDCLVNHFDRLFGTTEFPFTLAHIDKHKEILEILDSIHLDDLECTSDILGWVYEEHLRTGSSGKGGRDLGQYFTDRVICKYMVALCKPGFKAGLPGVPESVCDPSQGTAGFLTMWVKYFRTAYPEIPVNWAVQQKEVYGYDIDAKVAGIAALNMFMESGGYRFDNIACRDSLYDDIPVSGVDVILANMPFGVKGLTHAECCERVKALKLNGTKSEPLFLQLMMSSLNPGGRCAVVVPDGMLTNISKCHNGTRKYLLDHFELRRVIKMKGKFFMNTGIQPSILFFERTGKPTTTVEFWDVTANEDGSITETLAVSVPRVKMDASCSFDMRRYVESDKPVANPAGFPMVKLSEACEVSKGKRCLVSVESGGYPYQDVAHISRMVEKHILDTPAVLTPRVMSIGRFVYIDEKCHPSDDMFILKPKDNLNAKYLYYYCLLNLSTKFKESLHGVKPTIDYSVFDYTNITIPPLPIQHEIVATLDRIYGPRHEDMADTIKMTDRVMDLVLASPGGATLEPIVEAQQLIRKSAQMVADVKAQMAAIIKSSAASADCRSLRDVCTVAFGERITQKEHTGTLYPVYGGGETNFRTDRFNREGATCKIARFAISEKSMVLMIHEPYWLMDSGFTVTSKDKAVVLDEYLWWILWANQAKLAICSTGSCQKNISMDMFHGLEFGFPSLEVQGAVVSKIRRLQAQMAALESLQKQTGDNAIYMLEAYLGPLIVELIEHV